MSVTSFVIIPKNESEGKPAQNRHNLPVEGVSSLGARSPAGSSSAHRPLQERPRERFRNRISPGQSKTPTMLEARWGFLR
jgi:hypothetical protein